MAFAGNERRHLQLGLIKTYANDTWCAVCAGYLRLFRPGWADDGCDELFRFGAGLAEDFAAVNTVW